MPSPDVGAQRRFRCFLSGSFIGVEASCQTTKRDTHYLQNLSSEIHFKRSPASLTSDDPRQFYSPLARTTYELRTMNSEPADPRTRFGENIQKHLDDVRFPVCQRVYKFLTFHHIFLQSNAGTQRCRKCGCRRIRFAGGFLL